MKTAFECALDILTQSDKTEKQLYDALRKKKFDDEQCRQAVSKVKDYGYINDGALGKRFVENNLSVKGRLRMRADLKLKGLSDEDIEGALEQVTRDDELNAALTLAKKHFKDYSDKNKIYRYLAYRGFDASVIYEVVRTLCDDTDMTEEYD